MTTPSVISVGVGSETAPTLGAHAAGDIIFMPCESTDSAPGTPAGYTAGRLLNHTAAATVQLNHFRKVAASGAEAAPTITNTDDHTWGTTIVIRDADPTFHALVEGAYATQNVTNPITLPETKIDGCLILVFLAYSGDTAGPVMSAISGSEVTSITEQYDAGTITSGGGGICIISCVKTTAGPGGQLLFTNTSAGSIVYTAIALAPKLAVTVSGTVTIDGAPAADAASVVKIVDTTQPDTAVVASIAGGAGGFTALARYSTHNYVAVYDDGTKRGVSVAAVAP
jgi:hypothetical protein